MKLGGKLTALGVLLAASSLMSTTAGAAPNTPKSQQLEIKDNAAVSVNTEVNCAQHRLLAKVTNKTDKIITPTVIFDKTEVAEPENMPIHPGKDATFSYSFSDNNIPVETEVKIPNYEPLMLTPTPYCSEPFTFTTGDTSDTAVTGMLRNNSSMLPTTVFVRVNSGDIRTENLDPGESRLVALPFTPSSDDQKVALVTMATNGFESSYLVDLERDIQIPPLPKPQIRPTE